MAEGIGVARGKGNEDADLTPFTEPEPTKATYVEEDARIAKCTSCGKPVLSIAKFNMSAKSGWRIPTECGPCIQAQQGAVHA